MLLGSNQDASRIVAGWLYPALKARAGAALRLTGRLGATLVASYAHARVYISLYFFPTLIIKKNINNIQVLAIKNGRIVLSCKRPATILPRAFASAGVLPC